MFGIRKFETRGGNATFNAQQNLRERTHYVDDDSLRFHKSRILQTHVTDDGLLFALLESVALDWDNTRRGFRYVVFNIFGDVISRVSLEDCSATREAARKAMWRYLNTVDAKAETLAALAQHHAQADRDFAELRAKLEAAP